MANVVSPVYAAGFYSDDMTYQDGFFEDLTNEDDDFIDEIEHHEDLTAEEDYTADQNEKTGGMYGRFSSGSSFAYESVDLTTPSARVLDYNHPMTESEYYVDYTLKDDTPEGELNHSFTICMIQNIPEQADSEDFDSLTMTVDIPSNFYESVKVYKGLNNNGGVDRTDDFDITRNTNSLVISPTDPGADWLYGSTLYIEIKPGFAPKDVVPKKYTWNDYTYTMETKATKGTLYSTKTSNDFILHVLSRKLYMDNPIMSSPEGTGREYTIDMTSGASQQDRTFTLTASQDLPIVDAGCELDSIQMSFFVPEGFSGASFYIDHQDADEHFSYEKNGNLVTVTVLNPNDSSLYGKEIRAEMGITVPKTMNSGDYVYHVTTTATQGGDQVKELESDDFTLHIVNPQPELGGLKLYFDEESNAIKQVNPSSDPSFTYHVKQAVQDIQQSPFTDYEMRLTLDDAILPGNVTVMQDGNDITDQFTINTTGNVVSVSIENAQAFPNKDFVISVPGQIRPGVTKTPILAIANSTAAYNENTIERESNSASVVLINTSPANFDTDLGTNTGNQIDKMVGDNSIMAFDKYLSDPTGTFNNQNTYNITIEQAYFSNEPVTLELPEPQDIIVVLDASGSMGANRKIASVNNASNGIFESLVEENVRRRNRWDAGYYDGIIDENHDYIDDVTGERLLDHMLTMRAVIGYNVRSWTKWSGNMIPETAEDAATLYNAAFIRDGYQPAGDLWDFTRTDLAMKRAQTYIERPANTNIILITDGEPFGEGAEGNEAWDGTKNTVNHLMMTSSNTNAALATAKTIKDNGGSIYTVYVQPRNSRAAAYVQSNTGKAINRIVDTSDDTQLGLAFCMLMSNDSPQNGLFEIGGSDGKTFTGGYSGGGRYGLYTYFPNNSVEIVQSIADVISTIKIGGGSVGEYVNGQSYILDNITRPFNYSEGSARVYRVPRIKRNGDFEWGEREDITDKVTLITRSQKTIIVTGYDYAANAVTDYNKHLDPGATEPEVSNPGDYGYKLVLEFGIFAEKSFGGNTIITNDDETSGYYPSVPKDYDTVEGGHVIHHTAQPAWPENTSLNPNGDPYITLYPVPHVDLFVDYEIVSDNITIYAPQTANLANLVSDANNEIFVEEAGYADARANVISTKGLMNTAYNAYLEAMDAMASDSSAEAQAALIEALDNYNAAQSDYTDALNAFDSLVTYIPDGFNNAYVDIHYEFLDPDGIVIATMDIPHGESCTDEVGRIIKEWNFSASDGIIHKGGLYTINCTVSPVDTTKMENETGSTEAGSQSPRTVSKNPRADIFVLKITAKDTSIEPGQAIDFEEGSRNIKGAIEDHDKHIVSYEWVCTDGVTPSIPANEPGGSDKAVGGSPDGKFTVPASAGASVTVVGGRKVATGDTPYIPAQVLLSRSVGDINKGVEYTDSIRQTTKYLSDSDHLYDDFSSMIWEHICTIVDECDDNEFAEAQIHNEETIDEKQNHVRFLIHVEKNPRPVIHKTTSTPQIIQGSGTDIEWQVTLANNDENINEGHLTTTFSMVDVLPYVGDERLDPSTNLEGSQFGGDLYYRNIEVDFSRSQVSMAGAAFYYTSDAAARSDERDPIMNAAWTTVTPAYTGDKAVFSVPQDAIAIRMDASMPFSEEGLIAVNMKANVKNLTDQQVDDFYLNEAYVITKNKVSSEVVKTIVKNLRIGGVVWIDANRNGLRSTDETRVKNITVNLYKPHSAGGEIAININGTDYDVVYDANENRVMYVKTNENGEYVFNNLSEGTYLVVASDIAGNLAITTKRIGTNTKIDSDAEETAPFEKGAQITDITVNRDIDNDHNDIGLVSIVGRIKINKTVDDIYYPNGYDDAQKANHYVTFTFELKSLADGRVYRKHVILNQNKKTDSVEFTELPLGQYEVTEAIAMGYSLDRMEKVKGDVAIAADKATVNITPEEYIAEVNIFNTGETPKGVEKSVINFIPMNEPIQLRLVYTGPEIISDTTVTSHAFTDSEVYGIVTYDDGTTNQVSLSDLTLSPAVVTNAMNTGDGKLTVTGYYTERGITLEDNFQVGVDLKPVHKMTIIFKANNTVGIRFSGNAEENRVRYLYDEPTSTLYTLSGSYQGLSKANYTFLGWNTAADGSGIQYDDESALTALGADPSVNTVTLYAIFGADAVFEANGGKYSDNTVSKTEQHIVDQKLRTTLRPTNGDRLFSGWNTKADASGEWLDDNTYLRGPVTYYAIYSQDLYCNLGIDDMNSWTGFFLAVNGQTPRSASTVFPHRNYNEETRMTNIHTVCFGGHEFMYVPLHTVPGRTYTFYMDYCNPNGYTAAHSSGIDVMALSASPEDPVIRPSSNIDANPDKLTPDIKLGQVALTTAANPAVQHAQLTFTASGQTTWIAISWYAELDGTQSWIQFGNFSIKDQRQVGQPVEHFTDVIRTDKTLKDWYIYDDGGNKQIIDETYIMPNKELHAYAEFE